MHEESCQAHSTCILIVAGHSASRPMVCASLGDRSPALQVKLAYADIRSAVASVGRNAYAWRSHSAANPALPPVL